MYPLWPLLRALHVAVEQIVVVDIGFGSEAAVPVGGVRQQPVLRARHSVAPLLSAPVGFVLAGRSGELHVHGVLVVHRHAGRDADGPPPSTPPGRRHAVERHQELRDAPVVLAGRGVAIGAVARANRRCR